MGPTLADKIACTLDSSNSAVMGPWTTAIARFLPSVLLSLDVVDFILVTVATVILAPAMTVSMVGVAVRVSTLLFLGNVIIDQLLAWLITDQIQGPDNILMIHRGRYTKLRADLLQKLSMCLGASWRAELLDSIDQSPTIGY
jgi:hypothetical protein